MCTIENRKNYPIDKGQKKLLGLLGYLELVKIHGLTFILFCVIL